jgi:hypothetical protein
MNTFPTSTIGGYEISRLIIGSNSFHGHSHFSSARSAWLRRHFTPERQFEVIAACAREGLNATVSMQIPAYAEVLRAVEAETGVHIHWFATPGGRDTEELKDGICESAELGAEFCLPHTMWTDARLLPARGVIEEAEEVIAFIQSQGMRAGWSTHRPEAVTVSDRAGYDVDVYIQIYNSDGFLCQVETDWVQRVITNTPKPVLCIKPLGAGRIMPPTGLSFVYNTIKPIDVVAIGLLSTEEAAEDIAIVRQILAGQKVEGELQATRSKAMLVQ